MLRRRVMALIGWLLCTSGAGCIASSFPKTPEAGGPAWQEISSEHFVVDTDLDPAEATALVQKLENIRNVMTTSVFGRDPPPAPKGRVLALRDDEFGHFEKAAIGQFHVSMGCEPVFISSSGAQWGTIKADVRKHELAHYMSNLYLDARLQPRWFSEGFATYLETIYYDEKTGQAEIGYHPNNYQYLRATDLLELPELWKWSEGEPSDPHKKLWLYATSWTAVHYLIDERPDDLTTFEHTLAEGLEPKAAWKKAFPDLDDSGFTDAISQYLIRYHLDARKKTNVAPVSVFLHERPLSNADVLAIRAMLYWSLQGHSNRTPDEDRRLAEENLASSLRENPEGFWARRVDQCYNDALPDSVAVGKAAIEEQPDNWLAWLFYDDVLRKAGDSQANRRAALTRALQLAPQNQRVLAHLAALEGETGNLNAALSYAEKMLASPPVENGGLLVYAQILSRAGRCADANVVEKALLKRLSGKAEGRPRPHLDKALAENHAICRK